MFNLIASQRVDELTKYFDDGDLWDVLPTIIPSTKGMSREEIINYLEKTPIDLNDIILALKKAGFIAKRGNR